MRTTLNIDDDVLTAAKEIAQRERKSTGKFMSDLMREALKRRASTLSGRRRKRRLYGFGPIPAGGSAVTNDLVNELRGELAI